MLIIIGFILTYALCYNIWSSFAFPFYLDFLHYTKDQVAFASKVFGIFMTMIGISLGGYLFGRIGRFPTVLIGAAVTPLGNLLYADLADGGANIDAFTHTLRLNNLLGLFGADDRMVRLLVAICYENIATGVALTAFVAYLSGIISKKFTAVQYALLSSLTFLVGSLGRGVAGESFDKYGYAVGVPLDRRCRTACRAVRPARMGASRPRSVGEGDPAATAANDRALAESERANPAADRSPRGLRPQDRASRRSALGRRRARLRALARHCRGLGAKPSPPAISTRSLGEKQP